MAFINMPNIVQPNIDKDEVDLRKIRVRNRTVNAYASNDFTNGEEFEVLSYSLKNVYLVQFHLSMSNLRTTHTYDTNTLIHACVGLEFNVYIDDEIFQTVHLSCARSGIPSSTTSVSSDSETFSSRIYHFLSKETIMETTLNTSATPNTLEVVTMRAITTSSNSANRLLTYPLVPCGISNGYDTVYVGEANTSHRATDDEINYGTIFPMVKINNDIRVTAKYLFFNNLPDATNTATFESISNSAFINWIEIE